MTISAPEGTGNVVFPPSVLPTVKLVSSVACLGIPGTYDYIGLELPLI